MDVIDRRIAGASGPAPLACGKLSPPHYGELPEARTSASVAGLQAIAYAPALSPGERPEYQIRAEERSRIGRELHDSTSQLLVALQLSLGRLKRSFGVAGCQSLFAELDATLTELHREVRAVVSNDGTVSFLPGELPLALQVMALRFGRLASLEVAVSLPDPYVAPAFETELSFYRIAQEALANVARHAGAQAVVMHLESNKRSLELRIDDDGVGFARRRSLADRGGVGLQNIRQRVDQLQGRMSLRTLNRGSRLSVTVDL